MLPFVSIIIVNYKLKKELFSCIESIKQAEPKLPYEIIVVENSPNKVFSEPDLKRFPNLIYVKNKKNNGFGGGNNIGAEYARGEYLFFLNPDTIVEKNAIRNLLSFIKGKKDVGIVAPLLLDNQKKPFNLQGTKKLTPLNAIFGLSFIDKLFPNNRISKNYWQKGWNKKKIKEVDVIPGTAFLISKDLFEKIGRFDGNFFLYFEEADLCNRVKKLGLKIFITPKSKVVHLWGLSTRKSKDNIKNIFKQSRFYYFKKYFGIIPALLVESILRISKASVVLAVIFTISIILRFYRINYNYGFYSEVGDNLLDIKNAFVHHYIPLLGPPTSHPWLYFGPLFYWVYGPLLILSKFNPTSHAYFGAFVSILIIIANYIVLKRIIDRRVALISSYLISISPLYLIGASVARFIYVVPLLIYPFIYVLFQITFNKSRQFFLLALILGIMLNFHYTPIILAPFVISIFFIKKIKPTLGETIKMAFGFILPLTPLLLYDSMHKFIMLKNLILWFPYRILLFFGLYKLHAASIYVTPEKNISFFRFIYNSFIPNNYYLPLELVIFLFIIIYFAWHLFIVFKKRVISPIWLIILCWSLCGFTGILIHGSPPLHYFVPLYPLPIIVFSLLLSNVSGKKFGKYIVSFILLFLTLLNLTYLFSDNWFYSNNYLSYETKKKAAKLIVNDANGQHFSLKRIGYNDFLPNNFEQDYVYLLWLDGNEPVKKAKLVYTIIEGKSNLPKRISFSKKLFLINPYVAVVRD